MSPDSVRAPEDEFELLFICTANRARSAIAEYVVRASTDGLPVRVASAGILDYGSAPVLPGALDAARELGLDLSRHRSRCLVGLDLSSADLVVGFERQHVASAVVDGGAPYERSFLLPELVGLLRESTAAPTGPVEEARQAVAAAHAQRAAGSTGPAAEIADPVGGDATTFRTTATAIRDLAEELIALLFAAARRPG